MTSLDCVVRRATLDDLAQLSALWESMHFPVADLSRRVTEFQVAVDAQGNVLGALGLQMSNRQGLIHSEGFTDFALSDYLRPKLWDRINSLANNHGLLRIWTQEEAPFWNHCGLQRAEAASLEKLPEAWKAYRGSWLTLKLRDELDALISADQEFAAFMAAEKERTARTLQRAKTFKTIATIVAFVLAILVILAAVVLVRNHARLMGR